MTTKSTDVVLEATALAPRPGLRVIGHGLGSQVLGFGLDFEGQVLGLGFGDPGVISIRGPGLDSRAEKYLRYFEAGHNICLLGLGQNRRQLRFNLHVQCSA